MTQDEHSEDLIRYDVLTQDALRDVIRKVLQEVSVAGLPGEHHFFITFRTDHPGVRLSARMRKRYDEEMTIVIQHSFWDLKVNDTNFEISLSFDDEMERLCIPFAALKGFFDPHVKFGVQFDTDYLETANANIEIDDTRNGNDKILKNPDNLLQKAQTRELTSANTPASKQSTSGEVQDHTPQPEDTGAEIVSLDNFRKER